MPSPTPVPQPQSLQTTLRELLDLARSTWPVTADHVIDHLRPRAKTVTKSNANLEHPPWATSVSSPNDTFLELGGELAGAALPVDDRGHGQYVYLYVPKGTLADVEAVVGPLTKSPRLHWDSPQVSLAYPEIGGHRLRVLVEEARGGRGLVVKVHYEGS